MAGVVLSVGVHSGPVGTASGQLAARTAPRYPVLYEVPPLMSSNEVPLAYVLKRRYDEEPICETHTPGVYVG
jgi:hypothetical protein